MHEHVTSVCRAAYYHLKNIHCLKTFLTQKTLVTVVHAFVASCIDYCNSLLYGIFDYNINRLQNRAAGIVTNTRKYGHITPILQKLHFKSYVDCVFSVADPTLWNRLPPDIRNASSLENVKSVLKHICSR